MTDTPAASIQRFGGPLVLPLDHQDQGAKCGVQGTKFKEAFTPRVAEVPTLQMNDPDSGCFLKSEMPSLTLL